ncbi:hypothetical protein ILUMI_04625 [Ignelater luminosus]|uniref:Uncharacterized protein n=1 Tax=Ignelater luminosus TaxID=2038154 RepID=A0A8K0D8T3_IGNLU|nr:hypothetical protein ILUMI_04625 [Ignelater luminosus]
MPVIFLSNDITVEEVAVLPNNAESNKTLPVTVSATKPLVDYDNTSSDTVQNDTFSTILICIGFNLLKKDKWPMCEMRKESDFKYSDDEQKLYDEHIINKNVSKTLFSNDQNRSQKDFIIICASFDFQKVLDTPHGDNKLYYSRKYVYFNKTVYESGTREGFCYVWEQSDGNRGCNEIYTIIHKYLQDVDSRGGITDIPLYCDRCARQNRNRAVLSMLYKYLESACNINKTKIVCCFRGILTCRLIPSSQLLKDL